MSDRLSSSVLIPSFKRGLKLRTCLLSLAAQTVPPDEVIVVWQGDDTPTRDLAEQCRSEVNYPLRVLHSQDRGVVPAENTALAAAVGSIVFLIDDDAIAPPEWIAKHLAHYQASSRVGAVGGSAVNIQDGVPLPRRAVEPVGMITFTGRMLGNMYDHIDEWRSRPPRRVQHLVGYNMSLRRSAFDRFEDQLRSYWQMFEADACLQVAANGYDVLFDFGNVVEHHPSNPTFHPGRQGDLQIKIFNPAFNYAFILAKHTQWYRWPAVWMFFLLRGTTSMPGIASFFNCVRKYGNLGLELKILFRTWKHQVMGWRAGMRSRDMRAKVRLAAD